MYEIRHRSVASLADEDDQPEQLVAVIDSDEGEIEPVEVVGASPRELHERAQEQIGREIETLVLLGQEFFDIEARDIATLVALEVRERGEDLSSGPTYVVLEYDQHRPNPDAWKSKGQCRMTLEDLHNVSASSTLEIKQAVNGKTKSLGSTARLIARRSKLYPTGSPP